MGPDDQGEWVRYIEVERLHEMLRTARCPNAACDNDGHIAYDTGECVGYEPCQWCDERAHLLNRPTAPEKTP